MEKIWWWLGGVIMKGELGETPSLIPGVVGLPSARARTHRRTCSVARPHTRASTHAQGHAYAHTLPLWLAILAEVRQIVAGQTFLRLAGRWRAANAPQTRCVSAMRHVVQGS